MSYWTVVDSPQRVIPAVKVASCKQNMAPLLQGVCAYFKSVDFNDPQKQVRSFHRLLLVGPPGSGKSTTAEVIAQEYGFEPIIRNASQFRRDYRGQTANSIRDLFTHLASKTIKAAGTVSRIAQTHPEIIEALQGLKAKFGIEGAEALEAVSAEGGVALKEFQTAENPSVLKNATDKVKGGTGKGVRKGAGGGESVSSISKLFEKNDFGKILQSKTQKLKGRQYQGQQIYKT